MELKEIIKELKKHFKNGVIEFKSGMGYLKVMYDGNVITSIKNEAILKTNHKISPLVLDRFNDGLRVILGAKTAKPAHIIINLDTKKAQIK